MHAYGHAACFSKLIDRRLIEMMPYLVDMKCVHVDANMLLIYYCVLWYGSFCSGAKSFERPDSHFTEQVFTCCLRVIPIWQNEATGTIQDFIAAMFIVSIDLPRQPGSTDN